MHFKSKTKGRKKTRKGDSISPNGEGSNDKRGTSNFFVMFAKRIVNSRREDKLIIVIFAIWMAI